MKPLRRDEETGPSLRRDEETGSLGKVTPTTVVTNLTVISSLSNTSSQIGFMKTFGYLAEGSPNSEALHTEESITEAVKQMQLFGGLHPSGQLDEETLKVCKSDQSKLYVLFSYCRSRDVVTRIPHTVQLTGGPRDTSLDLRDGRNES